MTGASCTHPPALSLDLRTVPYLLHLLQLLQHVCANLLLFKIAVKVMDLIRVKFPEF